MKYPWLVSKRFYVILSVALYIVGVGIMFAFESMGWAHGTKAEMFYGPAITIVSSWCIIVLIFVLFRRK